jgi:hypothetical protein
MNLTTNESLRALGFVQYPEKLPDTYDAIGPSYTREKNKLCVKGTDFGNFRTHHHPRRRWSRSTAAACRRRSGE